MATAKNFELTANNSIVDRMCTHTQTQNYARARAHTHTTTTTTTTMIKMIIIYKT